MKVNVAIELTPDELNDMDIVASDLSWMSGRICDAVNCEAIAGCSVCPFKKIVDRLDEISNDFDEMLKNT